MDYNYENKGLDTDNGPDMGPVRDLHEDDET